MKKILTVIMLSIPLIFLTACESGTQINVETGNEIVSKCIGTDSLIEIGENLYYDPYTNIVYFWNGSSSLEFATMPSAYFAPNGLPYKYNPKTNTLEEIGDDEDE